MILVCKVHIVRVKNSMWNSCADRERLHPSHLTITIISSASIKDQQIYCKYIYFCKQKNDTFVELLDDAFVDLYGQSQTMRRE